MGGRTHTSIRSSRCAAGKKRLALRSHLGASFESLEEMEKEKAVVHFLLIDERLSQGVYLLVADFLKVFARQQPLLHNIAVAP